MSLIGSNSMFSFANAVIRWQKQFGRHDLPWQNTQDPYAIWVSEIMLQQTQVAAVIGYYGKFMHRFPDIKTLALGSQDEVLQYWSGLGYYSRARNLHASAQTIMKEFSGNFPKNFDSILSLPGIGQSTAAAISTFAFNSPQPILDGNVKRVFARHFLIEGWPGSPKVEQLLWQIAVRENPTTDAIAYTQGLMDLGATLCTRTKPKCELCPVKDSCLALKNNQVEKLPTPKPSKSLPVKTVTMLILTDGDELMLERRESRGIWGGLLSLPEIESIDDLAIAQKYPEFNIKEITAFEVVKHSFSHYKLLITPLLISVENPLKISTSENRLWMTFNDALNAAIPTPIRNILKLLNRKKIPQ